MKQLIKLVRISSKESFKKLRDVWKIYCTELDIHFKVTWLFLRHISWNTKSRVLKDIIERLSSVSLIERIWKDWILVETRVDPKIEKKNYNFSYKINLMIEKIDFFIVLAKKANWEVILISVFINYIE